MRSRAFESEAGVEIAPQPDYQSCGATCLHAVYRYYGQPLALAQVIDEVPRLETGGTLAVMLANHALRRGFGARIYTYNLQAFDPSWFDGDVTVDVAERLRAQSKVKNARRLHISTKAYFEFLEHGGEIRYEDLTPGLLAGLLGGGRPILTGLSATYLYRAMRERPDDDVEDDVRGYPVGHFVLLSGYESATQRVHVADPLLPNPMSSGHYYAVDVHRVLGAILLGVLTYDANLLVIEPPEGEA